MRPASLLAPLASLAAFAVAALALDGPILRPARYPAPLADPDRKAAVETVRAFQRYYADFFATGGAPALLDEFPATKNVRHQVFRDVGFLSEAGLVQVQDLATFEARSATLTGPGSAEVVVAEEWNYALQRLADRRPVSTVRGMGRGFRYALERRPDGRWWVTGWRSEPSADPAPIARSTW